MYFGVDLDLMILLLVDWLFLPELSCRVHLLVG